MLQEKDKQIPIGAIATFQRGIPSPVVYETLGVPQPKISYWVRTKLIRPSIRQGRQGKFERYEPATSLWSFEDFLELKLIVDLREKRLSLQRIRKVLAWLRARGYSLNVIDLLTDGEYFYHRENNRNDSDVVEILEHAGKYVLIEWADLVRYCQQVFRQKSVPIENLTVAEDVED